MKNWRESADRTQDECKTDASVMILDTETTERWSIVATDSRRLSVSLATPDTRLSQETSPVSGPTGAGWETRYPDSDSLTAELQGQFSVLASTGEMR